MRLQGKVAIVTGAGGGFGEGIAEAFAREGARVVVGGIRPEHASAVAARIGAEAVGGDVSRGDDVQRMVDTAVRKIRRPRHRGQQRRHHAPKPANAGGGRGALRPGVHRQRQVALLDGSGDVAGVAPAGTRAPIINIGSTAGIRPRPGLVWHNGAKRAVNIVTQCMVTELASDNIRVNSVCPVIGATGLLEEFMGQKDGPEIRAKFLGSIPLGRMSTPADIANACLWLTEDASSFITGILLPVDGGRTT